MAKRECLRYENQWESDTYFVGEKKVLKMPSLIDAKGNEYKLYESMETVDYYDHGHRMSACSKHYSLCVNVLGVNVMVDLNSIITGKGCGPLYPGPKTTYYKD